MKILWLGWRELYTTRRMLEAAAASDVRFEACEVLDLYFECANGRSRIGALGYEDLATAFDVLVVRTFHPYISESLALARHFRDAGKIVVDESLTDEGYAVSKMHDYLLLAKQNIAVPATWQIYDPARVEQQAEKFGYPVILKGVHGAHGDHVYLVKDAQELRRKMWRYSCGELALQEYLPADEDFRVLTVGFQALPFLIQKRAELKEFRTNRSQGAVFSALPLSDFPILRELAEKAARVLRREFAGVDIRFRGKEPVILEVNRRPDFQGFEQATQFDVARAFLDYLKGRAGTLKTDRL